MGHQQHTTAGVTLAQASLGGQHPRLELGQRLAARRVKT